MIQLAVKSSYYCLLKCKNGGNTINKTENLTNKMLQCSDFSPVIRQ